MADSAFVKIVLGFSTVLAVGCSGVDGATPSGAAEGVEAPLSQATLARSEVLAQLKAGAAEVTFLSIEGPDGISQISMRETALNGSGSSPMQELVLEQGLTSLETFLALSPRGTSAPDAFSAAHTAEARALGRDDVDSVRQVKFEPTTLVQKSIASCDAWVFTTQNGGYTIFNQHRTNSTTGVDEEGTDWTTRNVTVGACNESSTPMTAGRFWHIYDPTPEGAAFFEINSTWGTDGPFALKGLTNVRWYNWSVRTQETCSGLVCTSTPMMYRVQGSSASPNRYHLRSAELIRTIH
jgi:hypothetical protein